MNLFYLFFFSLLDKHLISKQAFIYLVWNFFWILYFNLRLDWEGLNIVISHLLSLIKVVIVWSISLTFKDIWRRFKFYSILEAHLKLGLLMQDRKGGVNWSLDFSRWPL